MNHQPTYGLQHQQPPSIVAQQPQQSVQSTMLWAQENRFVDSGVHTAAVPTNASSSVLSGRISLNNNEHFAGGAPLVPSTYASMEGYPSTAHNNGYQQIYTPSMASSELCLTHNFGADGSENGQYMTPDPRLAPLPRGYCFNYQEEADFYDVIHEVAKCLSDEDQVVVSKASEFLEDYCKQPGNAMAVVKEFHSLLPIFTGLIRTNKDLVMLRYLTGTFKHLSTFNFGRSALLFYGLLPDILNLLEVNKGSDQIIDRKIGGTLYNLSLDDQGRCAIYDCGAIQILIKMLESTSDSVVYHAITALHNLILHHPDSANFIRTSGSIQRFTMLIKPTALPKFLAILIDCLYQLASEHAETKIEILNTGCIPELITILTTFEYENLLLTTSRLMQALGVCKQNKQAIVAAVDGGKFFFLNFFFPPTGGLNALAHRLSHPSHRLLSSVLLAIRNMSDGAGQMKDEDSENLVTGVLRLLGSIDLNVVGWCTAILANLTCNNVRNKLTVYRNGGVRDLLRTIEIYHPSNYAGGQQRTSVSKAEYTASIVETLDSTLSVLRHVTARHPQALDAQKELRAVVGGGGTRRTGLHLIVALINGPPNTTQPTLLKPALRLLNDLAAVPENAQILYECGLSVHIFNHFSFQFDRLKHLQQQQQQSLNTNNNNSQETKICADVTSGCLSVSQVLCRYPLFKSFFRQDQVIDVVLRLKYSKKFCGVSIMDPRDEYFVYKWKSKSTFRSQKLSY
uniref:Beta-catenin n=1 Tax=Romanomermis culicivorax TaxID=13658 RepID=A0A915JGW5_ROMCU